MASKFSNFWRWVSYNAWYFKRPPWDTGVTPPELIEFVTNHPAGRALELGCGTGTNAIYLAQHGWRVIAIDFVSRAIHQAKRKANSCGVTVDFRLQDVTALDNIAPPFDLILDIGCYHSLPDSGQAVYRCNVQRLLRPGGCWLLYAFINVNDDVDRIGISPAELDELTRLFIQVSRQDGSDRADHPSTWLCYQKK